MEIKTLEGTGHKEILNTFNEAFSDYFIPFKLTEEQLTSKMVADKTDLNLSAGVFENGHLIAFILHGFDIINHQKIVYNGGTGVIPNKRGSGLTSQMYSFILPLLKEKGIKKVILEVITENIQAIKSYQKSGFDTVRELSCYKGAIKIANVSSSIVIKKLSSYTWQVMESFWDINPTWQNSIQVINELKTNNVSLGAFIENKLIGYIIYNPTNNRIQQIAVHKDFRRKGIASKMLSELLHDTCNVCSIINVEKSSRPINSFLKKVGFKTNLEQIEMKLELN